MPELDRGALSCTDLSFTWPEGTAVCTDVTTAFPSGTTGLLGGNGSGKSTLLRLLAGELTPTAGAVARRGRLAYLPQQVTLGVEVRVEQALGIAERRRALAAVEAGEVTDAHLETIGADWDIEQRAEALLGELGLDEVGLDRVVGELSGGQTVLLHLAALLLRRPDVLLLDEPTNNLDPHARQRLYDAVARWRRGVLVVVSHDRELLDRLDRLVELRDGQLTFYGPGVAAYEQAVATQQHAARQAVRTARAAERKQQRQLAESQVKLARRRRAGRVAADGLPKIVAGAKKRAAQESAGALTGVHQDRLASARRQRAEAELAVREDFEIRVDLPDTTVPASRVVASLRHARLPYGSCEPLEVELRGPQRIALRGRNGAGKTTLLRLLAGELDPLEGEVRVPVCARLMPQRLDVLTDTDTVAGNVAAHAPGLSDNEIRAGLAHFGFAGRGGDQLAGTLSGGQRLRAVLAAVLLSTPAPQLLLLDEPTNNLDASSVRALTSALASYRGALVVASHDVEFLAALEPTNWWWLGFELLDGEAG